MAASESEREDVAWLRTLLVRALREEGLRRLCRGEPATFDDISGRASQVVMCAFVLGVIFTLSDWTNASNWQTVWLGAGVLLAISLVGAQAGIRPGAGLVAVLWLAALSGQLLQSDHDLSATLWLPFLVTAAAVTVLRPRRMAAIARSSPLVLPVALSVLAIPLFTADLWSVAPRLHAGNLAIASALTILPLLFSVRRRLNSEVPTALSEAAKQIDADDARRQLEERLTQLVDESERGLAAEKITRLLSPYWTSFDADEATKAVTDPIRRQLGLSLVSSAAGLMVLAACYMGALAWALVPIANVRRWTGGRVDEVGISALGATAQVPLGPYVIIALLLGLLATSVLLASVAVDDEYARRLADALLRNPARVALATAVPYLRMRDAEPPPCKRVAADSANAPPERS